MDIATLGVNIKYDSVKQAGVALDKFSQSGEKAEKATKNLTSATDTLKQVLSGLALGAVAMQAIKVADAYTQMQSKLRLVTQSTQELLSVQSQLNKVAVATFSEQGAVTELYAKMQPSLAAMGKTTQDTVKFVETFNKALALTNPNAQQAQAAVMQFAQAMGAGALRGDEFASLMENANGVMQKLAVGLGVPIGALRGLAGEGKLTADVVYAALNNATESINSDFDKMALTVSNASQTIETGMFNLVGAINNATGATSSLAEVMHDFGQVLNLAANYVDIYAQASAEAEAKTKGMSGILDTASQSATNLHDVFRKVANVAYDVGTGIDMIVLGLGGLVATMASVGDSKQMQIVLQDTRKELDMIIKRNSDFKESLNIKSQTAKTVEGLKSIDEELKDIFGSSYEAEKATIKFTGSNKESEKAAKEHAKALKEQAKAHLEATEALDEQVKAISKAEQAFRKYLNGSDFTSQVDELNEVTKAWKVLADNGLATTEDLQKAIDAVTMERFGTESQKAAEKMVENIDYAAEAMKASIKRLDDAFADVWRDIFNGAEDFGSSLRRWFTSLLAELAHAAITKPIVISMSGAMGLGGSGSASASGDPFSMARNAYSLWDSFGSMPTGASGSGMMAGLQSAFYANGSLSASNAAISGAYNSGMYGQAAGTAVGTYLPYAANMYDGFQRNGVAGAAVSAGTTYGLIQLGSMFGPWGAAIGAILSMIGNGAIQTGIMGGARGERTRALNIGIANGQVSDDSNIYRSTHYDAGWGRSGSWNVDNLGGAEFNQIIKDTVTTMAAGIRDNAERLGFEFNEGFSGSFDADLFGKTAEETQQIIADTFVRIGESMVLSVDGLSEAITPLQKGSETSYEALSRLTAQFDVFNQPIGRLNDTLATLNMTTLGAVDSLVTMAGGIQNLQSMQSNFINAFYTDSQKAELTAQTVSSIFESIGMSAPDSREALVDMVKALDLTTEAGQRAYVALTGSTATLDTFFNNIEQQAQEAARVAERQAQEAARIAEQQAQEAALERAAALALDKKLKELKSGIAVSSEYSGIEAKLSEIYDAVAPVAEYQAKIKDGMAEALATELIALPILKEQATILAGMAATIPNGFSDLRVMMAEISRVSTAIDVFNTLSQLDNTDLITAIHTRDAALLGASQTRSLNDVVSLRRREQFDDTTALKLAAMLDQVLAPFADLTKSVGTLTKGLSQLNSLTEENKVSAEAYGFWLDKLTNQYGVLTSSITLTESGLVELNDAFKVSATIGQTVNKANLLNATLGVLTRGIDQGVNQLMTSADDYAKSVKNTIADVKSYTDNKGLFNAAIDAINAPLDAAKRVKAELSKNIKSIRELMVDATGDELDRLADALKTSNFAYTKAAKEITEYESTYSFIATAAEKLSQLVTSPTIESGLAQLPNLITDFDTSFSGLSQSVNESLGLVIGSLEQGNNDSIYSAFMQLNDLFNDGAITAEQYTKMIGAVEKAYIEGVDSIEKAYERLKNTEKTYEQIAQERIALEDQINQLTLTSDELRALELAKIDESNRYLQERIWQLMDEKAAQEEATKAQEDAAQAAENLRNAWTDATNSIQDEINRILGIGSGNATTYQSAQAEFAQAQAMTLLGDIDAAKSLPELSRTMLELAENQVSSAEELALIKGQTAASLADTLGLIGAPYISSASTPIAQLPNAPISQMQATNNVLVAELVAIKAELAEIKAQDKQVGVQLIKQTRTTAEKLEKWDATGMPA